MGFFTELFLGLAAQPSQTKKRNRSWDGNSDMFRDPHSPTFIDYRDKWGSNNDHNWEADGDTRWDSYE